MQKYHLEKYVLIKAANWMKLNMEISVNSFEIFT